ncbi:OmpH family outer membrane protein [Myxococcota bacterium]|jgi:outer membrane protein|nr:OmpH family outer membrane protein [Myxococcota bacterium]
MSPFARFVKPLLISLSMLLVAHGVAQAEVKLAFVDMQRALLEVDEGKKAKSTLEKMKSDKQRQLDGEQEALKKAKADFDTQKAMMKEDIRRQREEELAEKLGRLQMLYATLQKELAGKEAELTKDIFKRMAKILEKMGREQKWTMIFEKTESSVLWAEQSLDLTNELIRRYNAGEGK